MKLYMAELNTVALDTALETLFKAEGRDDAKRVYELLNNAMTNTWNAANAGVEAAREAALTEAKENFELALQQQSREAAETIRAAEKIGYEKGHAAAMFAQAAERLNNEAAELSPALTEQAKREATGPDFELVEAVSDLV
ncbi:hypothetical protein HU230_0012580 [Bradyrhizobium quebecense]|uniref:Uncharacterized protein n=1 Tax=Bradyrhizobium quebecense TaxID=2748629 RepID=A0A973WN40_9BRAD|nr:hypothetical protein [Bradyrhizobium quebecense]UGA46825.1 hypothetical protein HU230_0012580 [Bradyrhizobium quebecense]